MKAFTLNRDDRPDRWELYQQQMYSVGFNDKELRRHSAYLVEDYENREHLCEVASKDFPEFFNAQRRKTWPPMVPSSVPMAAYMPSQTSPMAPNMYRRLVERYLHSERIFVCRCAQRIKVMHQNRWQRQTPMPSDAASGSESDSEPQGPYTYPTPSVPTPVPKTIPSTSSYPLSVDLSETVTGVDSEDTVTVKSVREVSNSVESTDWDAENPEDSFAVPNEDGTLTYAPKGTYFRNVLIVKMEVAPPAAPPAPPGAPPPEDEEDEGEAVQTVEVVVPIEKDMRNAVEAHKTMWQGANDTCVAMAVGAVLKEQGRITDEWKVLEDGTLVIGPDGRHLNTPTLLGENNTPPYVVRLQTQAEVDKFKAEGVRWIGTVDRYRDDEGNLLPPAERAQKERDFPSATTIEINLGQIDGVGNYFTSTRKGSRWTDSFFEHYGPPARFHMLMKCHPRPLQMNKRKR